MSVNVAKENDGKDERAENSDTSQPGRLGGMNLTLVGLVHPPDLDSQLGYRWDQDDGGEERSKENVKYVYYGHVFTENLFSTFREDYLLEYHTTRLS